MKLRLRILPMAAVVLAVTLGGFGNAWAGDHRQYDRGHGSRHEQARGGHNKRDHDGGAISRSHKQWRQKYHAGHYTSRDRYRDRHRGYHGDYNRHNKGYGKHKGYSKRHYRNHGHYGRRYYDRGASYYSYHDNDDDDEKLLYGLLFGGVLGYVIGQSQPDYVYDYER